MSTIQIKNSSKRVNKFLKEGGTLTDNVDNNKMLISYKNYLVSINNKENTISPKLYYILLLEQYLKSINKTFETFTKENVYNYFDECSCLKWGLTVNVNIKIKQQLKTFLIGLIKKV